MSEKIEVIGVRFKEVGKVYYFDPEGEKFSIGDRVIVETSRGTECGEVVADNRFVSEEKIVMPLKKVIRFATAEDLEHVAENDRLEKQAFEKCLVKISEHGLDMKLVDVEYTFDNSKIIFYFTADGRIDFRELVKDLASSENLKGLGIDETTSITVGSLVSAVVDYNKNANSGGDNPEVQTMPTDAEGIGKATESFKDLADVVQTGISNSANTDAEYIFFASKEEMREFILSLQSSPYVYGVALSSGSTLGFTDMVGYTKLTDTEYSYLEELIEEDPVTFNEVKMKTIFGVKKSA